MACSPSKDKWLNRKFHTLTGHFNVYFNGEQKLLDAIAQIENGHVNNFDRVLEVFPLGTPETAKAAGNIIDEAVKKFSKTIQMHTIGTYTDDSYFAMGKCRFYKQDYFSSIETFQYVIGKYKNGEFSDASACWIAQNYVGMNKLGEAEALLGLLLAKKDLKKNDISLIYATAADINIKQEKYTTAIDNLKVALKGKLKKEQKIRYHYILGQLCLLSSRKPEASYHFNKVISFIPSYEYAFNANISLTRIYDVNDLKSISKVRKNLRKMANDEKNIDFLDQIYYELGKIDLALKDYKEAITNFRKSVAFNTKNRNQKGLTYYELAKLYFDQKEFKNAQAYYDSTVQTIDPLNKQFNQIKETKAVLSDLINNLLVYETEDSLQKLALLSKDEIDRKVVAWNLEEKRKQDLIQKELKKNAKAKASAANNQSVAPNAPLSLPGSGDNSWYFYNTNLKNSGSAEFFSNKKWGQRQNEDYWRIAAKEKPRAELSTKDTSSSKNDGSLKEKDGVEVKQDANQTNLSGDAEKDKWIANIPYTTAQKERSNQKMLEALHNLGVIYYMRLENSQESKKYLTVLQSKYPVSEYEPEAFFYLYKSNNDLKNKLAAEENKQKLISQYPTHPLSLLLQNKSIQSSESTSNKDLLAAYEKMYNTYSNGNYQEAMKLKSEIDKQFPGNNLKPKIDLLYAFCVGKTQNKEAFKKSLEDVSAIHKGLDVAKTADEYLEVINRQDKKDAFNGKDTSKLELEFDLETEVPFYYVVAFKDPKADVTEFVSQYANFNEAYSEENNLRVNSIMSNEGFQLITIREFPNRKSASDYIKILHSTDFKNKKLKYALATPEFIISTKNFRKVLKENKVEKFLEFYNKQEEQLKPKK
jgi:tetratricopeptide (TPR) repeat protein